MTGRVRLMLIIGLAAGLLIIVLVWRAPREREFTSHSSLLPPPTSPLAFAPSPLPLHAVTPASSPLPIPPTAPSPVTAATLEAIRATRPTAVPPSPGNNRLPYISPGTWRDWALRILAVAGVLAYIGLRLRKSQ
jgi:hypothetical protein